MRKPLIQCMATEQKKIIAIDFDGCLETGNDYPFIGEPNIELVNFIREHQHDYVFILWTMREGKQLNYAKEWIKAQGIRFDYYNQNTPWNIAKYGDKRKIYADYYIDNHNVTLNELIMIQKGNENGKKQFSTDN